MHPALLAVHHHPHRALDDPVHAVVRGVALLHDCLALEEDAAFEAIAEQLHEFLRAALLGEGRDRVKIQPRLRRAVAHAAPPEHAQDLLHGDLVGVLLQLLQENGAVDDAHQAYRPRDDRGALRVPGARQVRVAEAECPAGLRAVQLSDGEARNLDLGPARGQDAELLAGHELPGEVQVAHRQPVERAERREGEALQELAGAVEDALAHAGQRGLLHGAVPGERVLVLGAGLGKSLVGELGDSRGYRAGERRAPGRL
mmetsp:Transcript_45430/g.129633  ORF Transcript_45430/g.129633 Transcript_45430/m.129633 type:complete len:257 (+) Transcript_45430:1-771(+)